MHELNPQPADLSQLPTPTDAAEQCPPLGYESPLEATATAPPRRRGFTFLAWLVIAGVTAFTAGWIPLGPEKDKTEEPVSEGLQLLGIRTQEMLGRYIVGASSLPGAETGMLVDQYKEQAGDGFMDGLRSVAMVGELAGPKDALEQLAALRAANPELAPYESTTADALTDLYTAYAADDFSAATVDATRRASLEKLLGWFGHLALTPKSSPNSEARAALEAGAQKTLVALLGLAFGGFLTLGGGLVACCVLVYLLIAGKLRARVVTSIDNYGGIYAETFALWMATFIGASLLVGLFIADEYRFAVLLAVFPGSLLVLGWPVLRGVSWARVRADIGWSRGTGLFTEGVYGFLTYAATLPLLAVGILIMLGLMKIFGGGLPGSGEEGPSHPIVELILQGNWGFRAQLLILACVMAPLVEETMFRGVLYRHLRELTGSMRIVLSVVISIAVTSFVFAIIHPQGPLAVPALGALAAGFALARQWRGTLIPSMTAHAINNTLATTVLILLFT